MNTPVEVFTLSSPSTDAGLTAQTYAARDVANAPELKAAIVRRSAARGDSPEVAQWLVNHFFRFLVGNAVLPPSEM